MRKILFITNSVSNVLTHRAGLISYLVSQHYEVHVALPFCNSVEREKLIHCGISVHYLPLTRRGINPWTEVKTLVCIAKLVSKLKPDILHMVALKAISYGNLIGKFVRIKSKVNLFTGLGFVFIQDRFVVLFLRKLIIYFLRISMHNSKNSISIVQNDDDARVLIKEKIIKSDELRVIRGSGIDPNYFSYSPESDGSKFIIFAGRFLWDKGIEEFVSAAKLLRDRFPAVSFVLVGDVDFGNAASVSKKQLDEWVSQGSVQHWSWSEDMRSVFSKSHIVCLPSYREGLPKVLLEAAASGRAIITTDAPGCRDVLVHQKTGIMVRSKSVNELAGAIAFLIEEDQLRVQMGSLGREYVVQRFSSEKIIEQTMSVYNELLTGIGRKRIYD